ncbi:hypothetical protein [Roseiconus lacunae]|nr:hypothetical protein [Roseiconus lacunae]
MLVYGENGSADLIAPAELTSVQDELYEAPGTYCFNYDDRVYCEEWL